MPGSHRLKHILPLLFLALTATAIAAPYQAPDHHARMEHIVRNVSYEGGNELATILGDAQFHQQLADDGMQLLDAIDDRGSGLQAMVLKDQASGRTLIAFRGTELLDRGDIKTDADSAGDVGRSQYSAHLDTLDGWARDYPGATVIGHSLGGALGQRFIADHAGQVGEGVFFNSPGIAPEHAHRYASFGRLRKPPPVTIYVGRRVNTARIIGGAVDIYDYDIVSELGGQSHLPGTIVEVDAHALEQEITHSFQMFDSHGRKFGALERKFTQLDYLAWQKRRKAHFEDDAFVKRHVFFTKGEIRNFSLYASAFGLGWFDGATHGYFQYGPMIPTRTMIAAAPSKDVIDFSIARAIFRKVLYDNGYILPTGDDPISDEEEMKYMQQYLGNDPALKEAYLQAIKDKTGSGVNRDWDCEPKWTCADWSECLTGMQTRKCIDVNLCDTNTYKPLWLQPDPAVTQSCQEVTTTVNADSWSALLVSASPIMTIKQLNEANEIEGKKQAEESSACGRQCLIDGGWDPDSGWEPNANASVACNLKCSPEPCTASCSQQFSTFNEIDACVSKCVVPKIEACTAECNSYENTWDKWYLSRCICVCDSGYVPGSNGCVLEGEVPDQPPTEDPPNIGLDVPTPDELMHLFSEDGLFPDDPKFGEMDEYTKALSLQTF